MMLAQRPEVISEAVQDYLTQQPFELDDFQVAAVQSISEGHSVVVCAPTGSGKTVIAEFAAYRAIAEGKKLFYTTPLKALSNQKFHDLKARFGEQNVGLLTGDISINRDARLIVMTTEIFRNMLYGVREGDQDRLLGHIGYVVLDECHYMNDAERGTVWEESIIYCPDSIQIIALSATVANAQELTDWINEVHHDTRLIYSDFRPVPLRFSYFDRDTLSPLFASPGKLNPKLKLHQKGNRFDKSRRFFRPNDLIRQMAEKDMLPAIFFTFSRKDCDRDLEFTQSLRLLNDDERARINQIIDDYIEQNPFLKDSQALPFIRNGFASHHAGLLPGMKYLVEQLFQQGLIKVVFATETLAAGINMPARSTVITKISKRTNDGHRMLTASEFLQMSGRAGRRGMDPVGYVIVVASQWEGAREAATLASAPADALNSRFTPTYGMVLNLLKKNSMAHAEFLIRQSFGQFTAERRKAPLQMAIDEKQGHLNEALNFVCPYGVSDKDFHGFLKARDMSYDTARFVRNLERQVKMHGPSPDVTRQLAHEQGKLDSLNSTINAVACPGCDLLKKHMRIEEDVQRLQKKLKSLNRYSAEQDDTYWRQFMNIYQLLKEAGYLDNDDEPTGRGGLCSQIRSENEFAMTEILLTEQGLQELSPVHLAAVLCSLINDSNRENLFVRMGMSVEVSQALRRIDHIQKRVGKLQDKHHVTMPILLNPIAAPLVESWAQGMEWDRLINSTNIGEGDIVRMLRRTADILRQLGRMRELPGHLANTAKTALAMIYREPIMEIELPEAAEADPVEEAGILTAEEIGKPSTASATESASVSSEPSEARVEKDAQALGSEEVMAEPEPPAFSPPSANAPSGVETDFKPLGSIRDSFSELIKEDETWGRP